MNSNSDYFEEKVKECVGLGDLQKAMALIEESTKEEIVEWLDLMSERDLYEFIHEYVDDDIHQMDDLDRVFDWMTVTEVLENLDNIDTSDAYFSEDSRLSDDDIWQLTNKTKKGVAKALYDGDYDFDHYELDEIMRDEEELVRRVTEEYKINDKARALFEKALEDDPKELLAVLWNMRADGE